MAFDYKKEIQSGKWQKKSAEIKMRDNFTCQRCGKTSDETVLNVHHICYIEHLHYWEYPDNLLITLCPECHKAFHKKGVPCFYDGHAVPDNADSQVSYSDCSNVQDKVPCLDNECTHTLIAEEKNAQIYIPSKIIFLFRNFNVQQNRIFLTIISHLQDYYHQILEEQDSSQWKNRANQIISEILENNVDGLFLDISYKVCGIISKNYQYVRLQIAKLSDLKINKISPSEQNLTYPLFVLNNNLNERYSHNFAITLPPTLLHLLFDFSKGFFRCSKEIIVDLKNVHSQLIYLLICMWRNVGATPKYPVENFCLLLFPPGYNISRWNMFYHRVLLKARTDIYQLFIDNKLDIFFEIELFYRSKNQRGTPKSIRLHIKHK